MSDHIADLFALQHWRMRAAELEEHRDKLLMQVGADDKVIAELTRERDALRALLRECRPWVARGLNDHPAPTPEDHALLARLDAALGDQL